MTERRPVRVLPETVANQIAAGEVVERPASVVKELVENALDAGGTRIDIAVEGGGAKGIEIVDNGHGMDRADAQAALERQATSKIQTASDINAIATFGFRGEAIPSIASVSRFSLITRPAEADAATAITVTGGTLEAVGEAGHPVGTTVSVRDLFFNLPARRKFLRAPATELARIRQTVTSIALAHPEVAFRLRSDGRDLLRLPAGDTLEDRIRALLNVHPEEHLLRVEGSCREIQVHGYLSKPEAVRGGTPEQYIFINRRPATAPQIQYALREAWPHKERRPTAILFIDLPPEGVDVNVHPAKREVRFRDGTRVVTAVMSAVERALAVPGLPPAAGVHPLAEADVPHYQASPSNLSPVGRIPFPQAPALPTFVPPAARAPRPVQPSLEPVVPFTSPPPPQPPPAEPSGSLPWKWTRVVEVLEGGYWLAVTDQGYITVDARAALERIHYERFASDAGSVPSQPLLLPETLRLPAADAERVKRFLPELEACGFGISPFGADTFLVDALPVAFTEMPPATILAALAVELENTGVKKGLDAWRREVVSRAAAKAVCRTAQVTSREVAEQLMARLAACAMPYTTPRGKPVMILTTYRELARRFQHD